MRRNCCNARVFFEVEGAEIPAPGEPGLNRVGYWYRLLTLVFHTSAYQTAELDERLARIDHLGDTETDISGGGLWVCPIMPRGRSSVVVRSCRFAAGYSDCSVSVKPVSNVAPMP